MRFYALLCTIAALSMLLTPAIVLIEPSREEKTTQTQQIAAPETIDVFLSESENTVSLDMEEYLVGAVAAEISASCHPQALMAQAVACHTFALYRQQVEITSPTQELHGAALSDVPQKHQGYLTEQARREQWGDDFAVNEKKIRQAVQAVLNEVMTYDGKPICAVYFALSPGQTESAQTVFGDAIPYLQSASSDADTLSPDCVRSVVYSDEEFRALAEQIEGVSLPDDTSEWISAFETTDSGFVKLIEMGGRELSGMRFREAFTLRSPVFTVSRTESGFRVTTKGYGHLVGMSQYGAESMARSGADHVKILRHFYKDITISGG